MYIKTKNLRINTEFLESYRPQEGASGITFITTSGTEYIVSYPNTEARDKALLELDNLEDK